jgi:hypothetical protein
VLCGSNWAANACDDSAQPCQSLRDRPERPHEESDLVPSVVHPATLELTCHAGGRGFESRRCRSLHLAFARFWKKGAKACGEVSAEAQALHAHALPPDS